MKNSLGDEVVEEGNVVPFPAQAAPSGRNEFGDQVVESDHATKLITGRQIAPEAASKAISLSDKTGTPAPIIKLNPEKHEQNYDLQQGMAAAERNPNIKNYINNVPLAASVSKNDWTELDEYSASLERLRHKGERQGGLVQAFEKLPETIALFGSTEGRQRLGDALLQLPVEIAKNLWETFKLPGDVASGKVRLDTREGLDAAINMAMLQALGQTGRFGTGSRFGSDLRFGKPEVPGQSSPAQIEAFLGRVRGIRTKEDIDAFLKEKSADVELPKLQIEDAARASANLKSAIEHAQETATKEISTQALEQFSDIHGDLGTVHIPAQTLLDLYRGQGKIPMKGDGLFGWVPKLAEKLQIGAETGTEIAIPLSKYISNIDPSIHTQISDFVRVHEEGTTPEEAEGIKLEEQQRAELEKAQPQPTETEQPVESPKPVSEEGKTGSDKHRAVIANTTIDAQGKVRKSLYLDPLFTSGKELGVTQHPEFANYSKMIDKANEIILQKAVDFAEREVKKRQTAEWKSNESVVKGQVLEKLHERPDIKLDRFLRTGSLRPDGGNKFPGEIPKLDRKAVEVIAGKGALERYTRDEGTADLQVMADTFGFASKEAMIEQLIALTEDRAKLGLEPKRYINELADTETAVRMEAEHGKLLDNIAIEASDIALASFNVDLLTSEWKMLAVLAGREPPSMGGKGAPLNLPEMKAWVADQFSKAEVGQVSYKTFERASYRAGREAEKALTGGKFDDALAAKQTQMLNFLLAKEAKGFEGERRKSEKLLDKYAGNANLPRVQQEFTDQIHALMLQYGIRIRRTQENVEHNLGGKDLSTFIAEQQGQGEMLVIPQLPIPGTATLNEFTVNQYRDFSTLIRNLDHVGKGVKEIEIGQKKEDRFQAVDKITKNLDVMEKEGFDPDKVGPISALRRAGRYIDSKLLKAETLINWIDLNDPLGAMTQSVHRPLIEGQYKVGFMLEKIAKLIRNLPSDRAWGKALNEIPDSGNHALIDWETREPLKLTNENKISIALNYGNKGNRRVMLLGHHWTEAEVEAYLDKTMTKMDWQVVKGIHGLFEPLAPLVEKVTRRRSGLAVPLVEPTPFLESQGGYYPLVQNPRDVLLKAKQQTDLFDRTKFDPLPMAPALKQRTGSVYKLDFSLNRLHSILGQTTHAVFMQEPVINANKVIKDPLVREGIANAFGPEYVKMLDDWIKDIANNGGMNDDMWASWVSRNLRENVVTMLMGWKVSTALIHGGSAGAATLFELGKMHLQEKGPKSFVLAPAELIKNMRELGLAQFLPETTRRMFSSDTQMWDTIDEVMSKSQELPNRIRTLQKDFGFQLEKIFNKNIIDDAAQARAVFQAYAMSMVSALDLLTATPVWKAAEAKALVEGHDPDDAIFIADKAVREAHGSASLVSRANIGRGELNKWLTIAYNGYWNHNYNKSRQTAVEVAGRTEEEGSSQFDAKMKVALLGGFITAMLVAPALVHHAIRGDEAETTEGAVLGMMASQLGGQIPILNTLTYSIIHNRDPSVSPIEEVLKSVVNVARDLRAEEPKKPLKHLTQMLGYSTGLMSNQIIDLVSALRDVSEGDQDPETVGEWANMVITGKAKPKESGR